MNFKKPEIELFTPKINNTVITFLLIVLVIIVAIIIITFDKGFDFADEGYYLLCFKHTDIYRGGIFNFHIIISKLTDWFNPGIIAYRWMSFLIITLSSFILSLGLFKWIKANYNFNTLYKKYIFIFCFISTGNYLYFFTGLQTISYNTLINFFLQVSTGLVLYLFSFDPGKLLKFKSNIFILITLGFVCSFSFFTKFSTGILQIFVYTLLFVIFLRKQPIKNILLSTTTFASGSLMGFLIYFIFFQNYSEWLNNFYVEFAILPDHTPKYIIKGYFYSILTMFGFFLNFYSWLIIFPILIFIKDSFNSLLNYKVKKYIITTISVLSVFLFIYQSIQFKFYRSTFAGNDWINAYFYIAVIIIQLLLIFAILLNKKIFTWSLIIKNFDKIIIILFLLCSTIIGLFGTINIIFLNALLHIAPWFAVMLILLIELSRYIRHVIIHITFIICIVVFTATQIIDGNIYYPYYSGLGYRTEKNAFFQQTEYVPELPLLNGIKVDKETKTFLLDLKMLLDKNNFKKGYPIFGFYIPGIVYLLDGISPGIPFYFNEPRDCIAIEHFNINRDLPIIILSEKRPISNVVLNCLRNKKILYPEAYLLIGEVKNPEGILFKVYFPKTLL